MRLIQLSLGLFASIAIHALSSPIVQASQVSVAKTNSLSMRASSPIWLSIKLLQKPGHVPQIIQFEALSKGKERSFAKRYPLLIQEGESPSLDTVLEWHGSEKDLRTQWLKLGLTISAWEKHLASAQRAKNFSLASQDELRTLVNSGPSENRIDLVFMGDGYTLDEREKFFSDIERLVNDLFEQNTYSSYLPIFNVHAVFRPSENTGLPRGRPGRTAYGLYREGNTYRAIFPGNPPALRESCQAAPDCDYPVVVANDDFYGGLGGEFAITTRSPTSGTIVLRHELGHNFGRVGEEYDGGGYFGANHSSRLNKLSWMQWLGDSGQTPEAANLKALALAWPWQSLATAPFKMTFQTSANRPYREIQMSLFGLAGSDRYAIRVGEEELLSPALQSNDRSFVTIKLPADLRPGRHELEVQALQPDGDEMIASFAIHEFGFDPQANPETIGAFALYDQGGRESGYRPTNNSCLMRNMLHPSFCSVCQENNWRELLGRINLIDKVRSGKEANGDWVAEIQTLELGQFRNQGVPLDPNEQMKIIWSLNGEELIEFENQTKIRVDAKLIENATQGTVRVDVFFDSNEIRAKDESFWKSTKNFSLSSEIAFTPHG